MRQPFCKILICLLLFCALLAGCAGSKVEVIPELTDGTEILPNTSFTVHPGQTLTAAQLREKLSFEPGVSYSLAELPGGGFSVKPIGGFAPESQVLLRYDGEEFRFRVANRLAVRTSFPSDQSERVSIDTGIEIGFNQREVSEQQFRRAVTIDPPVAFRISRVWEDGRFTLYAEEAFEPETTYTVTVSPPLVSQTGAELTEPYQFSFTTAAPGVQEAEMKFRISGAGTSINALTDEQPVLEVWLDQEAGEQGAPQEVAVTLYRFESWEPYYNRLLEMQQEKDSSGRSYERVLFDTAGLAQAQQFTTTLVEGNSSQSHSRLLLFPEPLAEGWYLAELDLTVDGFALRRQILIQSSDLSVFFMRMSDDLLLWVNDAETGEPVADASFEMAGGFSAQGRTGPDGVLLVPDGVQNLQQQGELFENEQQSGRENSIFRVTAGERTFVDANFFYANVVGEPAEYDARDYYSYLYCDRPLYRTTDTIKVWGVVRPRDPARPVPEEVSLRFMDGVAERTAALGENGTFIAELSYTDVTADYWGELELRLGETVLTNEYLRVEDFVKPVYTTELASGLPVYLSEENPTVELTVDVSTFDGTPASGVAVRISHSPELQAMGLSGGGEDAGENTFLTDADGRAAAQFFIAGDEDTWRPQRYYYGIYNADAEAESFFYDGSVSVIHRDLMLEAERVGTGEVQVSAHRIDRSRITDPGQLEDIGLLRGAPVNCEAQAEIHRVYYEEKKTGTYYDYLSHTRKDIFEYEQKDEIIGTRTFPIENGTARLTGLVEAGQADYYYLLVRAQDSYGLPVEERCGISVGAQQRAFRQDGEHQYRFERLPGPESGDSGDGIGYQPWQGEFQDGETVVFQFVDKEMPIEQVDGRILYTVAQKGFGEPAVIQDSRIALPFSESMIPGYAVAGAYFDGKHIYALQTKQLYFNPEKRELEIALHPDREQYQPGDAVQLEARVFNKITRQPAADAQVALGVVDEAVFAMGEQYVNLLNQYYRMNEYIYIESYTSYGQKEYGSGHEKGGGGGGGVRKEFEDTAWFGAEQTDAQGRAVFRFTLPDNITSWRTTALALTGDGQAGDTKENLSASLPYFLNPIVNETLLEGDTVSISLRSMGTGITGEDLAAYTAQVLRTDGTQAGLAPVQAEGTAGEYVHLRFDGTLPSGSYLMRVSGRCGPLSDTVELPFTVAPSGIEIARIQSFDLSGGITVDSLRYPVTIGFFDAENRLYSEVWRNLQSRSIGSRLDQEIARGYLARELKAQGAQYDAEDLKLIGSGSRYGLLSELPYMDTDDRFTLRVLLAFPELFGRNFAEGIAEEACSPELYAGIQALAGTYGAQEVRQLLEGDSVGLADRLYLGCVLAQLGEQTAARELYDRWAAPNLSAAEAVSGEQTLTLVPPAGSGFSQADCTAAAAMLASSLGLSDAEGLIRSLLEKDSHYDPYLPEQLYYLERFKPAEGQNASFSYQKDGKREMVDLSGGKQRFISFTREQLDGAAFRVESGTVQADVSCTAAPGAEDQEGRRIGLIKTVEPVDGTFAPGALVRITLTPDFSAFDTGIGDLDVVIDDLIPAGMRYEKFQQQQLEEDSGWRGWALDRREGQRIRFRGYGKYFASQTFPIVYYARCVTTGNYVVESAYINSVYSGTWGMSERAEVEIE